MNGTSNRMTRFREPQQGEMRHGKPCELLRELPTEISVPAKIRPGRRLPLLERVGGSSFAAKKSGTTKPAFVSLTKVFLFV